MARRAFTLMEMMLVLLLLALLAGSVVWSLTGQVQRTRRADAINRLAHADAMTRVAAQRVGPCVLRIDLDEQTFRRVHDSGGREHVAHRAAVPEGYRVDRVVVGPGERRAGTLPRGDTAFQRTSGMVEVAYASSGRSGSYALHLTATQRDDAIWLVFAGLTGHMTAIEHDNEVDNLFALLAQGRADAD